MHPARRFLSLALPLALPLLAANAADARPQWRDLTPFAMDAFRVAQGHAPRDMWQAPGAPALEDMLREVNAGRPRLSGPELLLETEHAIIHYTLEGDDAATIDQVNWTAESLEYVWALDMGELGYPAPPPDGIKGGGVDKYDFYFTKQALSYGVTHGETIVTENTATSWIELATWMNQVELQVTVAHEFFHALHYGMDYLEEDWLFEVTATWMEDVAYDDINDYYNYIPSTFAAPETPITEASSIMYANAIWAHSQTERFGRDLIRDIWLKCAESKEPQALANDAALLAERGATFAEVIHNFRESMFDLDRFEEGDAYAQVVGEVDFTYTAKSYPATTSGTLEATGAAIIQLLPTSSGDLSVRATGDAPLMGSILVELKDGSVEELISDVSLSTGPVFDVPDLGGTYQRAVLVITNTDLAVAGPWSITAEYTGSQGGCSTTGRSSSHGSLALSSLLFLSAAGFFARRRRA